VDVTVGRFQVFFTGVVLGARARRNGDYSNVDGNLIIHVRHVSVDELPSTVCLLDKILFDLILGFYTFPGLILTMDGVRPDNQNYPFRTLFA